MNDPQLMQILKFDEADLQANRNGLITDKQRARLLSEESSRKGCAASLGILLIIIALIGVGAAVAYFLAMRRFGVMTAIPFSLGFGCIWPLVWGGLGIGSLRRAFVKLVIQVKKAEGPVNIVKSIRESYNSSTHTHSSYAVHELHVGGLSFDVQTSLPNLMMQGDVYAVYFADNNQNEKPEILSVDLLSNANPVYAAAPAPAVVTDDAEVVEFLQKGNLLKAIQAYRAIHNTSFEESRNAVLEMQSRLGN